LIAAVRIKALDRRLGLGLDPDIADRADPDKEGAALRVDHQVPVLVALDNAKHALLGQHLGAIGAGHRLALVGRHIGGGLGRHRAGLASLEIGDVHRSEGYDPHFSRSTPSDRRVGIDKTRRNR
jgi:hypothetical protein